MTCRILCFALSIKGKTVATFLCCCLRCVCESLVRSRGVPSYTLRVIKIKIDVESLVVVFSCCIKSLRKKTSGSTCGCYGSRKEVVRGLGAVTWSW